MTISPRTRTSRIADYTSDAVALDEATFRTRHGDAFLLHWGELADAEEAEDLSRATSLVDGAAVNQDPASRPQANFLVFPVRSTGRSPYSHFISVGRTANNDVVLVHDSVSKFHAFFKQDEAGAWTLQDAGSRNGTYVDEHMVLPASVGKPAPLRSGARVRFGLVEMSFLSVSEFRRLVQGVFGRKR